MRWAGYVSDMGVRKKCMQAFGWEPEGKGLYEDLHEDRRMILKWILKI
jgi:hypothetical protein